MISFNAKQVDQKVKVWWDVQSETAVAKYIVERTTDYSFITEVASQLPVGPSTSILHYEDWDLNPLKGMQYYRLKTLSIDGTKQFSQYVPVNFNNKGLFQITSVAPNANTGSLSVQFVFDGNGPYDYILTDVMGKVIATGKSVALEGANQLEIPASISTGLYMITIQNVNSAQTAKFHF